MSEHNAIRRINILYIYSVHMYEEGLIYFLIYLAFICADHHRGRSEQAVTNRLW